jgi:hypothetical protein
LVLDRDILASILTLEPIRQITFTSTTTRQSQSTRRIPSAFEASKPCQRLCSRRRQPGYTRNSLRCFQYLKIMRQEFCGDQPEQTATLAMGLGSSMTSDLHTNSQAQTIAQVAIQELESRANAQISPETPKTPETHTIKVDTRPIWPERPEIIYQAYLAEKENWFATNPTVMPAQYRNKRGLTKWGEKWCRQHKKFLPSSRLYRRALCMA